MKNLIKKYGISEEKFKEGIDIVAKNLGLICDGNVMLAVTELLAEGDIAPKGNKSIRVRDIAIKLKSGHLLLEDLEGNEISSGTIEDEELLDLEVVSIELVDDIYLLVKVEA